MINIKHVPAPYIIFNRDLVLIDQSDDAKDFFKHFQAIEEIIDQGSLNKFQKALQANERQDFELVMNTKQAPMALFQCSLSWKDDMYHLICVPKDEDIKRLEELVQQHSKRLASTNFELLEQKEKLEESLKRIKMLSAPFIRISKTTGVVLFYGEFDRTLIEMNQNEISKQAFNGQFEQILFDFNGIGDLEKDGVDAFYYLIQRLQVMGIHSSVIGLSPKQVFHFNKQGTKLDATFKSNLHDVIYSYLSS
ncbi:anti-sigma factor [Alkalihalophilus pseudofirmus OF4]|uniref:Anti-sigma factor n=1 Tax=Alkalihalophilus pseudofirmus (strain ATCC BAA-2126 / JCM 17055 / OF4) TaxID=398511 RepID=D3FVH7_ALKPO|nr:MULTISPECIES: anti-sigma factor [Alkalihalophilus]ADC48492.1 anti-sigma factor [Alkalihalophilus pseudofirmus OF4]MED1601011.1 hypothetical protein [Alkalihalophilus marmarensis]